MKFHTRSFDGRFWVYLYAGPLRLTVFRSHLFYRPRRRGFFRQLVGVGVDVFVLAAIAGIGGALVHHFAPVLWHLIRSGVSR